MANVIAIGDSHQDISWVKKILKQENNASGADKIVMLGDWLDTKSDEVSGSQETANYMMQLDQEFGDKIVWHHSNHDLPYYYALEAARNHTNVKSNPFRCSATSNSKAKNISKIISDEFIKKQKLATLVDNVLYSHAGATPDLFNLIDDGENKKVDLEGFLKEADDVALNFKTKSSHPFFRVGFSRGGSYGTGGLTWRDFPKEVVDDGYDHLPVQIFGHSACNQPIRKGNNFCIDCRQSWYAIVTNGEFIEFKNLDDKSIFVNLNSYNLSPQLELLHEKKKSR